MDRFFNRSIRMVKLKVIKGGKSNEKTCVSQVKLFSAHTIIDNYHGRDGVKFNWIYLDRQKPVAPFERIIENYKQLDERVRPYFEQYINELFTQEEVETLKKFLTEKLEANIYINEEPLPSSGIFVPMPFKGIPAAKGRGFYYPSQNGHSNLPFSVCAYFDLKNCPPSLCLQQEAREKSILYLQKAIAALGLECKAGAEQLHATVDELYDQCGLFVDQGKTREERLQAKEQVVQTGGASAPEKD
jgi:hypothetical protein